MNAEKGVSRNEKILIVLGCILFVFGIPLSIYKNVEKMKYYVNQDMIEVKGVCIENIHSTKKGRVIRYKFEYLDILYYGNDIIQDDSKG